MALDLARFCAAENGRFVFDELNTDVKNEDIIDLLKSMAHVYPLSEHSKRFCTHALSTQKLELRDWARTIFRFGQGIEQVRMSRTGLYTFVPMTFTANDRVFLLYMVSADSITFTRRSVCLRRSQSGNRSDKEGQSAEVSQRGVSQGVSQGRVSQGRGQSQVGSVKGGVSQGSVRRGVSQGKVSQGRGSVRGGVSQGRGQSGEGSVRVGPKKCLQSGRGQSLYGSMRGGPVRGGIGLE